MRHSILLAPRDRNFQALSPYADMIMVYVLEAQYVHPNETRDAGGIVRVTGAGRGTLAQSFTVAASRLANSQGR